MNRLQSELQRLYRPARAAVLELARPADWQALSALWRGVQADLALPAPAIAVNGSDGFQLWFSLAAPVPAAQALAFLEALRARYLGDIAPARIGMMLAAEAAPPMQTQAQTQTQSEQWSAFIAADLAPVFEAEPWIDTPPGVEGQADLLMRLAPIKAAEWLAALARLGMSLMPDQAPALTGADLDPRRFLQGVLNDATLPLGLRIEAAKALLPGAMQTVG